MLEEEIERQQEKYIEIEKRYKEQIAQLNLLIQQERADANAALEALNEQFKEMEERHRLEIFNYKQQLDNKEKEAIKANILLQHNLNKVKYM